MKNRARQMQDHRYKPSWRRRQMRVLTGYIVATVLVTGGLILVIAMRGALP